MTAGRVVRPVDAAGLVAACAASPTLRRSCWAGATPRRRSCPTSMSCRAAASIPPITCHRGFRERPHPAVAEALIAGGTRRPPIAFLRAALRETHEETGLVIGGAGSGEADERGGVAGLCRRRARAGFRRAGFPAAGHHAGRFEAALQHPVLPGRRRQRARRASRAMASSLDLGWRQSGGASSG